MSAGDIPRLIAAWMDGSISREDFATLEQILRSDSEARMQLRREANLDILLREDGSLDAELNAWNEPTATIPHRPSHFRHPSLWAMAAALALLLCLVSFFWGGHHANQTHKLAQQSAEETNTGCAILTRSVDAVWEHSDGAKRNGDTLRAGPLHLKSGLAQIEFFSGATLLLEGDAELEIVSALEAVCHHGKARVRVPPPAHGFKLEVPGMKLVDLGTEFGLEVDPQGNRAEVQVFDGEVEAHPEGSAQVNLKKGEGLQSLNHSLTRLATVKPEDFAGTEKMDSLSAAHGKARHAAWQDHAETMRHDSRLIAFFPFQPQKEWDRFARNTALPEDSLKNGGVVGATWAQGRWPMKSALEFKRPGDRVRLRIPGRFHGLTFAAWVRVDGLDRKYNALLLTDRYDPGAPHWQIYEDGRLMFSISYPDPAHPDELKSKRNQIYFSPVVFNRSETGRWHHIAVTYDSQSGEATQYFDGKEISREVSPFHIPGREIIFGDCELGNWGMPTEKHRFPIRNFNGRMDEFAIFRAALSPGEIKRMYEAGNPE
jgi:hypothetical protein